jgi:hypothetical protein
VSPCVTKRQALGVTATVLDIVLATIEKLNTTHFTPSRRIVLMVHEITPEIWTFYGIGNQAIDESGFTMRNQIIFHAINLKAIAICSRQIDFPGFV